MKTGTVKSNDLVLKTTKEISLRIKELHDNIGNYEEYAAAYREELEQREQQLAALDEPEVRVGDVCIYHSHQGDRTVWITAITQYQIEYKCNENDCTGGSRHVDGANEFDKPMFNIFDLIAQGEYIIWLTETDIGLLLQGLVARWGKDGTRDELENKLQAALKARG